MRLCRQSSLSLVIFVAIITFCIFHCCGSDRCQSKRFWLSIGCIVSLGVFISNSLMLKSHQKRYMCSKGTSTVQNLLAWEVPRTKDKCLCSGGRERLTMLLATRWVLAYEGVWLFVMLGNDTGKILGFCLWRGGWQVDLEGDPEDGTILACRHCCQFDWSLFGARQDHSKKAEDASLSTDNRWENPICQYHTDTSL